jgi:hypothetical protein
MPRLIIPIDLGNNKKGAVSVTEDVAKYFNITAPTTATAAMIEKPAVGFSRKVYSGVADITGRTIQVRPGARRVRPPKAPTSSGGKSIRVPTDITITDQVTVGGVQRTRKYTKHVSIRFPSGATMAAISKWLFEECKAKKPTYFIAPSGAKYSVVDDVGVADINPGPPPIVGATA